VKKLKTQRLIVDGLDTRIVLDGPGDHLASFCNALADIIEAQGVTVDRAELKADARNHCTNGHLDVSKILD
jgi:hypothetical protein